MIWFYGPIVFILSLANTRQIVRFFDEYLFSFDNLSGK